MVSLTRLTPYEQIVSQLKKTDRIALITCNTCPRFCGVGGVEKMDELASRLRGDGYMISDQVILTAACINDYIMNTRLSEELTAAVVLACEAGWCSVKQRLPEANVVKATDTLGLVIIDREAGIEKLLLPYEAHRDKLGNEYKLLTGELQEENVINWEVEQ
jgi:hypothetical protein